MKQRVSIEGIDLGIDLEKLSPGARIIWRRLSEERRLKINKHYPFRADRDQAVRHLKARGIKICVLCELTGLGRDHIRRISKVDHFLEKNEFGQFKRSLNLLRKEVKNLSLRVRKMENVKKEAME